ncbi:MAG: Lrp/AsnC ligand binding domain-containing protein [Dehalococcoidales bacterium]|jgi:DNA-binding Lrp family transcriptional regulator|nr:Lrp/AsnC ligand binding domain-containing protein [Dehalococcoidales bacterium]
MAKAYILIETTAGKNREIVNAIKNLKGVTSVDYVTGPYDIIAIVEADNLNEIGDLITEKIHPIPGITRTITCLSLKIDQETGKPSTS